MEFPGHELRTRRLELDLTTDAAASACAIPVVMLDALETAALDRLPATCYTIGFIRSYCRLLQLESEYYVCALRRARGEASRTQRVERSGLFARLMRRLPWARVPGLSSEVHAWIIIIAVLAMGWVGYTLLVRPEADPNEGRAHAASVELRVPSPLDQP